MLGAGGAGATTAKQERTRTEARETGGETQERVVEVRASCVWPAGPT